MLVELKRTHATTVGGQYHVDPHLDSSMVSAEHELACGITVNLNALGSVVWVVFAYTCALVCINKG